MADFQYIHIAFRGEVQDATRTIYSYPSGCSAVNSAVPAAQAAAEDASHTDSTAEAANNPSTASTEPSVTSANSSEAEASSSHTEAETSETCASGEPQWDDILVEPGAAIKRFLNATDCYVMQSHPTGHYFSLITRDTIDASRGYVMITMHLDNGCALTGRQILNVFNSLKQSFIEENNLSDQAVDTALHQASAPVEPVRLESWTYHAPEAETEMAEAAYRTFISVQELETIFSFPAQPEYEPYRCIIIVSAASTLRPGVKMPRITSLVRKLYTVVCPEGVVASSPQVFDGDRLTLTYSKPGFNSHTETVTAGTPSAYVKNDGSTLQVRTSTQTGIRFIRRVKIRILSTKGNDIKGYTISVNGHPINTMEPFIEFTERDLMPGEEVEIQVASNNYQPLKLKKPSEELLSIENLDLTLKPIEQFVTLRLDFGDDRVFEEQISIEKNTPEYNRLHSGNFHGFRAHRQVTQDDSEVYNVDVRITSRPVAPNFETSVAHEESPAGRAPIFEKVNKGNEDTAPRERKASLRNVPPTVIENASNDDDGSSLDDDMFVTPWYRKSWLWVIIAIILVAIGTSVYYMDFGGSSDTATMPIDSLSTDTVAAAQPLPVVTGEEQIDIDYLNSYPVWEVDKLRSPMAKQLIESITAGDIDAVVNNPYFKVNGRCTNRDANMVADLIWRAKGSYSESSNKRLLRSAVKNGTITLHELADDLAKRRPAEKENTAPRPSSAS